jgi:1-acyl-sn-glycerol-3-phosphate acyltransferase
VAREESVWQRIEQLELPFGPLGVDPLGVSKWHLRAALTIAAPLYRHYFRAQCHGLDHVPASGRVMLVGNHSGGVALDAVMVMCSLLLDKNPPRLAQAMAERFVGKVPLLSVWSSRTGSLSGLPEHARRLLEFERVLLVFPEGAKGTAKLFKERHSLVEFGTGFMRLAMEMHAPIVPFAVLGGGEAIPTVANLYGLGKLLGAPYIPVTPYLLPLPLPAKIDIYYGAPMQFSGTGAEDDAVIASQVAQVKAKIAELIELGRKGGETP